MTTIDDAMPRCAFARAILARQAGCPLVRMTLEGEVERPLCASPVANTNCLTLHGLFRERAAFALKLPPPATPITHAAEMRVQCGGLHGLALALDKGEAPVTDVHALVARAGDAFGGLLGIPFETVVASVVRWESRPRAGRKAGPP